MRIFDSTRDRYSAIALVSSWNISVIHEAKVLIVGAGALGNEIDKNLAMIGVGCIYVLDYDIIEVANISRSIFYREKDHGLLKTNILCKRIKEVNPDVKTVPLTGTLEEILGLGLLRNMDMIFSCLDNRLARRSLNRMCQKITKSWVDGAMENLLGEVTPYLPDDGPCYECYLTQNDKEILAQTNSCKGLAIKNISLGRVPTTPTMGSIISAVQVQEAFKILHGEFQKSNAGKKLIFNFHTNDFYTTRKERVNDCEGHFRFGIIQKVPEWTRKKTTPKEIMEFFYKETSVKGEFQLGRELLVSFDCPYCLNNEKVTAFLGKVPVEKLKCPNCTNNRNVITIHKISEADDFAEMTLEELGLPLFDVYEVKSNEIQRWYEITGDSKRLL